MLRITNYLNSSQKKTISSGIMKSQFSYCPLIWMFSSRKANNLINRIHYGSIRILNGDNQSNFETLLGKNKEITIHQRNFQVLMIKVLKIITGYARPIMDNFFMFRENKPNLRDFQIILNENKETLRYDSETISYRTPRLWANLLEEYKLTNSLTEFKSKIKTWRCDTSVCRLYGSFLQNFGFI